MMPEIKIKHVISFSSEDKTHKAENILRLETYRKWKCDSPGEKKAVIEVQFEKATKIHSIDIGNECSAFVEVLVKRSSDSSSDYQVLLVASSFMSPLESRNETHTNRVRMFDSDKLSKNIKEELWDCAQIVCTQPFNKNITYGLSFIKFHSPPEAAKEPEAAPSLNVKKDTKFGGFKLRDEEENDAPSIGMWFKQRSQSTDQELTSPASIKDASSYAAAILATNNNSRLNSPPLSSGLKKRKLSSSESSEPPAKRESTVTTPKNEKNFNSTKGNENPKATQKPQTPFSVKPKPVDKLTSKTLDKLKAEGSSQKKPEKRAKPFDKIMEKVVFVLSGFVNPLRSELRDKAVEMGAKYKADWDKTCTHLICAFINTPKYNQVLKCGGRIVHKLWIKDCYRKKELVRWKKYKLGDYSRKSSSDETESDLEVEVISVAKKEKSSPVNTVKNDAPKVNGNSTPKRSLFENNDSKKRTNESGSETEDEDALKDYMADTDAESNSGGDTEDEIEKVLKKNSEKQGSSSPLKTKSPQKEQSKPDTSNMPLPELPDFFKQKHFYLYGDFSTKVYHDLERYITAYNGVLENYMSDKVKYVISESEWDHNFDEALSENEDLIFVKPRWIFKCNDVGKFVPYQPYIIIPNA